MCTSFEENLLYSVEFHNDMMGSIIPVIPMWAGVMRFKVFGSTDRASNAPAELVWRFKDEQKMPAHEMWKICSIH